MFAVSPRDCHRGGITRHLAFQLDDDQVSLAEMIVFVATGETTRINPDLFGPLRKTFEYLLNVEPNQRGLQKRAGAVTIGNPTRPRKIASAPTYAQAGRGARQSHGQIGPAEPESEE